MTDNLAWTPKLGAVDPYTSDVTRQSGGFIDEADRIVTPGDRVQYRFKPDILGTIGDIMCDGDADVEFDDGTFETVKWKNLAKWPI
jgi:hypothetical protein